MTAPAWLVPALAEAGELVIALVEAGVADVPGELRSIRQSYEQRTDAGTEEAWAKARADRLAARPRSDTMRSPPDTEPGEPPEDIYADEE